MSNHKFQRIPEYIEAFQMTPEIQADETMKGCPEWAKENRKLDNRKIGAIFPTNPSAPSSGLSLRTEYGEFPIEVGKWVCKGASWMLIENGHFVGAFVSADFQEEASLGAAMPKEPPKKAAEVPKEMMADVSKKSGGDPKEMAKQASMTGA
jgi:hypothetical protein